jgi:glycosyltransferase involved in cell wall biosynthesis
MRVLQLIDSLDAGGAERVAVNFANSLFGKIDGSYIVVTRKEGLLKSSLSNKIGYLFLNKTKTIDIKALIKLKRFIKAEKITIIHAHSTSVFTALLVKLLGAKVKIVWHDHYGKSDFLEERKKWPLKLCSYFIKHVFSVNDKLANWSSKELKIKSVSYLPNFVIGSNQIKTTILKEENTIKIVCLANLRPQKDHENLIKAFCILRDNNQNVTLHLIGKDFKDAYSKKIKTLITTLQLDNYVFLYGSCNDTFEILKQAQIGVLASNSEGLPLSLLECGYVGLPVVSTNVGDCNKVITHLENGLLIPSQDSEILAKNIEIIITNPILAKELGENLKNTIENQFSETVILKTVVEKYHSL